MRHPFMRGGGLWLLMFMLLLSAKPTAAQNTLDLSTATPLQFGEAASARLDNSTPRALFRFEGLRGEFISLSLRPLDGNLDPLMLVMDSNGALLASQDDGLGRGSVLDTLRIPRNDVYYVVVTRFGGSLGNTLGNFELSLERVGVSSQSGSTLRYQDTVINTITNTTPQFYYSFTARRGDILNITMQRISGDLDPYLQIVNSNATLIAENDDTPGSMTLDATVGGLVIEQDGVYIIIATRYGEAAGTSVGSFVLSLQETDDSGLGNTLATAAILTPDTPVQGEITAARTERFYTFRANENDLVRIRMDRQSGTLDAYLELLDPNLAVIASNDDGGGGQNAQISEFRLPTSGLYTVRATRFDGATGTTTGRYQLLLELLGGAFDEIPQQANPILYGSTVTGVINDEQPSVLYAFYGTQGDVITVSMNRGDGNLDPTLRLLGENQLPIISDDDSGGGQNARIERFVLGRTGIYYIEATRYSGTQSNANTRGSFILVLAKRAS